MTISTLKAPKSVIYPARDGRPTGETDKHRELMAHLIAALKIHFSGQPSVYVPGNNFVLQEEGQPKLRVSQDAHVVSGPDSRLRGSCMAWKEGDFLPSFCGCQRPGNKLPVWKAPPNVLRTKQQAVLMTVPRTLGAKRLGDGYFNARMNNTCCRSGGRRFLRKITHDD